MFHDLNVPQNVEKEKDILGGGRTVLDSGLYKATIVQAYGTESRNGTKGLVIKFEIHKADGSVIPFTNTFWVTNREGSVTYTDKEGKQHYMIGFNQVNSLCKHLTNTELMSTAFEKRIIPVFNFEQRKDVPTEVNMAVALLGKEVALGLLKVRENKSQKVGDDYVPTPEEVFNNSIDKIFFMKDGKPYTAIELDEGADSSFAAEWVNKWKDKVQDKYKTVSGGNSSGTTSTVPLEIG